MGKGRGGGKEGKGRDREEVGERRGRVRVGPRTVGLDPPLNTPLMRHRFPALMSVTYPVSQTPAYTA